MKRQLNYVLTSWRVILSLFAMAILITGCSAKNAGDGLNDGQLTEADLNAARDSRFGGGSIPTAEGEGLFRDIHFAFNSSELDDDARQAVDYNAEVLRSNPNLRVELEGHCDERGTAEYNLALGEHRSRTVKRTLESLGVSADRITTISYGEEIPLDMGHNESAWSRNRRVHFSAFSNAR